MKEKLDNLISQLEEHQRHFQKRLEEILTVTGQNEWTEENILLLKEQRQLEQKINSYQEYKLEYEFYHELINSKQITLEEKEEVDKIIEDLYSKVEEYMISLLFSEEETKDCFLELQSGTGGDDAEDLTVLLMKMYIKWSEYTKRHCSIVDIWYTDHGVRSAILKISGNNSYGFLKLENGIHRVVRHSPFNSLGKRQTSFISVYTYPMAEEASFELEEKDLTFEFSRSSGAGGQHVNKTESAVRVIHNPTGVAVRCENERSQIMNKKMAIKLLKAKLITRNKELQKDKESAIEKAAISWGNQIRSYVFNPYQLVKDLRSGYETKNIAIFIDGILLNECLYFNLLKLMK